MFDNELYIFYSGLGCNGFTIMSEYYNKIMSKSVASGDEIEVHMGELTPDSLIDDITENQTIKDEINEFINGSTDVVPSELLDYLINEELSLIHISEPTRPY